MLREIWLRALRNWKARLPRCLLAWLLLHGSLERCLTIHRAWMRMRLRLHTLCEMSSLSPWLTLTFPQDLLASHFVVTFPHEMTEDLRQWLSAFMLHVCITNLDPGYDPRLTCWGCWGLKCCIWPGGGWCWAAAGCCCIGWGCTVPGAGCTGCGCAVPGGWCTGCGCGCSWPGRG